MANRRNHTPGKFEVRVYLVLADAGTLTTGDARDLILASKLNRTEAQKVADKHPGSVVHRVIANK